MPAASGEGPHPAIRGSQLHSAAWAFTARPDAPTPSPALQGSGRGRLVGRDHPVLKTLVAGRWESCHGLCLRRRRDQAGSRGPRGPGGAAGPRGAGGRLRRRGKAAGAASGAPAGRGRVLAPGPPPPGARGLRLAPAAPARGRSARPAPRGHPGRGRRKQGCFCLLASACGFLRHSAGTIIKLICI